MAQVEIFTTMLCPFCYRAKKLLDGKSVAYHEIDIMLHPKRRAEMIERAGGRTSVPQVFIGDVHVGGSDELYALESAGRLDPMLQVDS